MAVESKEPRRTIVCFDSWTVGYFHLDRLVSAFKERGFDLLLIHIGSWGHDKDRPKEEYIGALKVRDISYYGKADFADILKAEDPAAVLFLSTRAFVHLAFNRYARILGIPTIHLYHGLVSSLSFNVGERAVKTNWANQIKIIIERVGKNAMVILPTYCRALLRTKAPFRAWKEFLREVSIKATGEQLGLAPHDSTTDCGFVYSQQDIEHMAIVYRVPRDKIFAVGNPDLIRQGIGPKELGCRFDSPPNDKRKIIYVACGFVSCGLVYRDQNDFVQHLVDVQTSLKDQGFSLSVKLHPADISGGVGILLEKAGVDECSDLDFFSQMLASDAVICEPSSMSLVPALLGLPVALASFGRLKGQKFGIALTSYPRSIELNDIDSFALRLGELSATKEDFDRWAEVAAGPLPAERMPERIAHAVENVLADRAKV